MLLKTIIFVGLIEIAVKWAMLNYCYPYGPINFLNNVVNNMNMYCINLHFLLFVSIIIISYAGGLSSPRHYLFSSFDFGLQIVGIVIALV